MSQLYCQIQNQTLQVKDKYKNLSIICYIPSAVSGNATIITENSVSAGRLTSNVITSSDSFSYTLNTCCVNSTATAIVVNNTSY